MDTDSARLSHDTAFDLLSNGRRRLVLRRIQGTDGVELGDLATELSAIENDVDPDELSAQQRKRTYVSLYQTHIPKLESAGVVTFDSETGIVRPTDRVDELAAYFGAETQSIAWERRYALVASAGLVLYVAATAFETGWLDPFYVGIVALLGVVALSAVHARSGDDLSVIPAVDRSEGTSRP
jgi:hypothetical protein